MAQRDESLPAIGYRLSAQAEALEQHARRQTSLWGDAARRLRHDRAAVAGLAIILVLVLVALFAPAIAPKSPTKQSFMVKLQGPSREYPMGTDEFGRDTLSRV